MTKRLTAESSLQMKNLADLHHMMNRWQHPPTCTAVQSAYLHSFGFSSAGDYTPLLHPCACSGTVQMA